MHCIRVSVLNALVNRGMEGLRCRGQLGPSPAGILLTYRVFLNHVESLRSFS
jgi:hypothetical protein